MDLRTLGAARSCALIATVAVVLLWAASPARAAVAQISDPTDDVPLSFSNTTDLTSVGVAWEEAKLRIALTYKSAPRATAFELSVSEAAADQLDPDVRECDTSLSESFGVSASNGDATLTVPYVEGKLTAAPAWQGLTVTYTFSAPALGSAWARTDPFTCVSGSADGDDFFGAFPGRTLKITSRMAHTAIEDKLRDRFGDAFDGAEGTVVSCPASGFEKATEDQVARAWCRFEFSTGASLRFGWGAVLLLDGQPVVTDFRSRRLDGPYRGCGTFGANGRGNLGWTKGPVFGFYLTVWSKGTPCSAARRLARRATPRGTYRGWRCRTTKSGYEFLAMRCTRKGGRVVRLETGS